MDYFPILHSAVSALNPNEPRTRAAVYNRARQLLADRLTDAAGGNAALSKELLALENAVQRIEDEFLDRESLDLETPRRSPYLDRLKSYFSPPREEIVDLDRRPGTIWKIAAAVSAVAIIAIVGGMGLSYWMDAQRKTASATKETLPLTKAAEAPLPDVTPDSDQRPYTLRRQLVYYRTTLPPGAIVISKSQKFLYLVRPNVVAMRYSIGIGSKCADSVGLYQIADKQEFPGWDDPVPSGQIDLLTRNANPLGARALYLERDERRIHGISRAIAMGSALACFQLVNDDVIDLFERVPVGTRVVATN